jgi:hypothetical protein
LLQWFGNLSKKRLPLVKDRKTRTASVPPSRESLSRVSHALIVIGAIIQPGNSVSSIDGATRESSLQQFLCRWQAQFIAIS